MLHYIHDGARIQTDPVLASEKDLTRLDDSSRKTIAVNCFQSVGNLSHVAPKYLLRNVSIVAALKSIPSPQVLLCKSFGQGVIIVDEYQGAVLEASVRERVVDRHDTAIAHTLPSLNRSNGLFIGKAESCEEVRAA